MGTVLSLWMNSYTVISPQRLVSPQSSTSFLLGVQIVGWSGLSPLLIGDGRRNFSLSLGSGLETLLKQVRTHFLPTLVRWGIFVQMVCCLSLLLFYFIFYFFCTTVRRPSLNKFYLDHVQQACSFPNRTFHSLSSHQLKRHLLTCSLCVNMSYLYCKILIVYFVQILTPFFFGRNGNNEGKQGERLGRLGSNLGGSLFSTSSFLCREKEDSIQDDRYGQSSQLQRT